jgi:hypothetical protein
MVGIRLPNDCRGNCFNQIHDEEQSSISKIMAIVFSVISMTVVGVLVIATVIHCMDTESFLFGNASFSQQEEKAMQNHLSTIGCSGFQILCSEPQL